MARLVERLTTLGKVDLADARLHDALEALAAIPAADVADLWPQRSSDSCTPLRDVLDARTHLADARRRIAQRAAAFRAADAAGAAERADT